MFSGGTGTKEDPYLIGSVADLEAMRNYDSPGTASFYKQICDIDFEWANWVSPGYFFSAYDGQGYKIMNVNEIDIIKQNIKLSEELQKNYAGFEKFYQKILKN